MTGFLLFWSRGRNWDEGHSCPDGSARSEGREIPIAGRVPAGTGSGGPAGRLRRSHRIGAEAAHDLVLAVDPRGESQAVDLYEVIKGHLGFVSNHLDPDGLRSPPVGLDRGQPDDPDRRAIGRAGLRLTVLGVLLRLGDPG